MTSRGIFEATASVVPMTSNPARSNIDRVPTNAIVVSIVVMMALCLLRVPVAIALVASAILGGLQAGMSMTDTIAALNDNKRFLRGEIAQAVSAAGDARMD